MPEKIACRTKLSDEAGLRLGLIGFLVAVCGVGVAFITSLAIGYWLGLAGMSLGFFGIGLHFYINWRKIFMIE